jgi:hypothetical protein
MTTEEYISYRDVIYRGTCQHCNKSYEVEWNAAHNFLRKGTHLYPDIWLIFALCDCNEDGPQIRHFCNFVLIGTPKDSKARWGSLERAVSTFENGLTTLQALLRSNNE